MFTVLVSFFFNSPFWIVLSFKVVSTFQKYGGGHNSNSKGSGCGDGCQMSSKLVWLLSYWFDSILSYVQNGRQVNVTWLTVTWLQNLNCTPNSGWGPAASYVRTPVNQCSHAPDSIIRWMSYKNFELLWGGTLLPLFGGGRSQCWYKYRNTSAIVLIFLILSSNFSI